jgi:hypothetical protein
MEKTLDLSRWREKPLGIASRRWTIASLGLRQLSKTKLFRLFLIIGWSAGLLIAVSAFVFSQAVANGGWLETYAAELGPRVGALASALGALILLYPDVCVGGLFTLMFWAQSTVALTLCLFALTMIIPGLVTRDRNSNALTIYLSRPLTSVDYLIGKFGTILGVLLLLWTGPLLTGWVASMLLSPSRDFFVHSFPPVTHALYFNLIALLVLAPLALGVSAIGRSSRTTVLVWLGLWIIIGFVARAPHTPAWLKHASFSYNLEHVQREVFKPGEALKKAGQDLPLLNRDISRNLERIGSKIETESSSAAYTGLAALVLLCSAVFVRKLRPE